MYTRLAMFVYNSLRRMVPGDRVAGPLVCFPRGRVVFLDTSIVWKNTHAIDYGMYTIVSFNWLQTSRLKLKVRLPWSLGWEVAAGNPMRNLEIAWCLAWWFQRWPNMAKRGSLVLRNYMHYMYIHESRLVTWSNQNAPIEVHRGQILKFNQSRSTCLIWSDYMYILNIPNQFN
jgi:hypothetical protein